MCEDGSRLIWFNVCGKLCWHHTSCCSHHNTVSSWSCSPVIHALKDVVRGDCRSIYYLDLLQSYKFLMSIQTIVHPSEAYYNLLTVGRICSLVCHHGVERSGYCGKLRHLLERLVPLLSASRLASARRCICWFSWSTTWKRQGCLQSEGEKSVWS